jgi:protein SCO1
VIGRATKRLTRRPAQTGAAFIRLLAFRLRGRLWSFALSLMIMFAGSAWAHDNTRPAALRDVAFDQKLNQQVPLDLAFQDERGKKVQLADYFEQKPVILTFVYYQCRELCPLLLDGVVRALRALSFDVGTQFDIITVSFDAHDKPALAAAQKKDFVGRYARPGAEAGWHFLTGEEAAIERLSDAVGFRYSYDPQAGEFAHATGIVLLTPEGKTARYFYGIDFSPRDLRLGLIEAAQGQIGSTIDQLLLFCYHYNPAAGKYGLVVANVIRAAGTATVLILGAFILLMLRRERANCSPPRRST